jgi:hypothetical protein
MLGTFTDPKTKNLLEISQNNVNKLEDELKESATKEEDTEKKSKKYT